MTDRKTGEEPKNEKEPIPRLRIGDIVMVFFAPGERRLVLQGDLSGTGYIEAVRLHDGDTHTDILPGTVSVSDITAVVGHMDPRRAIDLAISSTIGSNPNSALETRLRDIMAERLAEEEQADEA